MSEWVKVAQFHRGLDLNLLLVRLAERGIDHRISIEGEDQILWVTADAPVDDVTAIVREVALTLPSAASLPGQGATPLAQLQRFPVVAISLLLSILGAAMVSWQSQWVHWFTFQDFELVSATQIRFSTFEAAWDSGQYWRLVTPAFLHFGIFHVAFNGLWVWEFGRRIEAVAGSSHLLMVMLVSAVASNWSQYLWNGPSLFGGMSGVLYALLGYIWIRNLLRPDPALAVPPGIIAFMLGWLVLCMTGIVDFFMRGSIANAAHVSGLAAGMVLGAVFALLGDRRRS